jgi:hypothetical protein
MEQTIQAKVDTSKMVPAIRIQGKWFSIRPKPYEPERQTYNIVSQIIRQNVSPEVAYKNWFEQERKDAKLLYPSFGKND